MMDPLVAMAESDPERIKALLGTVQTDSAVRYLFATLPFVVVIRNIEVISQQLDYRQISRGLAEMLNAPRCRDT
jgi:hypothetical protein